MYKNSENQNISALNFICQRCTKGKNWFRFVRSACSYEGVIKECIHLFKYKKKLSLRKLFANLLLNSFNSHFTKDYDLIMAVPMHPLKKFYREFNQSEILARDFSFYSKIKYLRGGLKRIKFGKSQTSLNSSQRKENIKGALKVSKPHQICGKKILLIDDVATTLSTANECAKSLLLSDAKLVDVLTLARG
jgi:ComF family protein